MNPKFKIGLVAALILAAAFVILWRPAGKSINDALASVPATKPIVAPFAAPATKLPALTTPAKPTTVALPVMPTAAPFAVAAVAPTPADSIAAATTSDPQAEIDTAVDDIIGLLQSSEILAFYEKYTSPAEQANWPESHRAELAREDALVKANPSGGGMMESMIGGFESMKGQTPQMNAAGDKATFQFTMIPPPGVDAPPRVTPMVMVRVDGKWYLKM